MNTKQLIKEVNEGCILAKIERKEIIELLQEDEGYKNMWKELRNHINDLNTLVYFDGLEEKYFPKEEK